MISSLRLDGPTYHFQMSRGDDVVPGRKEPGSERTGEKLYTFNYYCLGPKPVPNWTCTQTLRRATPTLVVLKHILQYS
jgi:hypothetical protein